MAGGDPEYLRVAAQCAAPVSDAAPVRQARRAAQGELSIAALNPFMRRKQLSAGARRFARGDSAERMYSLVHGQMRLEDSGINLGPGANLTFTRRDAPACLRNPAAHWCTES